MRSSLATVSRVLAALVVVPLLATACNGDKETSSTQAQPPPQTAPTTAGVAPPPPTPATGSKKGEKIPPGGLLLLGTRNLYPLLPGRLASYAPSQVTGQGVRILTIASPTALWVGKNKQQRLLINLRLKGEGGPALKAGQKATFVGALLPAAGKETSLGLKGNDVLKLTSQGAYLDVSAADFRVK